MKSSLGTRTFDLQGRPHLPAQRKTNTDHASARYYDKASPRVLEANLGASSLSILLHGLLASHLSMLILLESRTELDRRLSSRVLLPTQILEGKTFQTEPRPLLGYRPPRLRVQRAYDRSRTFWKRLTRRSICSAHRPKVRSRDPDSPLALLPTRRRLCPFIQTEGRIFHRRFAQTHNYHHIIPRARRRLLACSITVHHKHYMRDLQQPTRATRRLQCPSSYRQWPPYLRRHSTLLHRHLPAVESAHASAGATSHATRCDCSKNGSRRTRSTRTRTRRKSRNSSARRVFQCSKLTTGSSTRGGATSRPRSVRTCGARRSGHRASPAARRARGPTRGRTCRTRRPTTSVSLGRAELLRAVITPGTTAWAAVSQEMVTQLRHQHRHRPLRVSEDLVPRRKVSIGLRQR